MFCLSLLSTPPPLQLVALRHYQIWAAYPSGNWSLAGFNVVLKRFTSPYIMKYYLPCAIMASIFSTCEMSFNFLTWYVLPLQVCVSWISFLIPSYAIPGRTTLLVTLFLVLTGFFGNIQVGREETVRKGMSATITCPRRARTRPLLLTHWA